MLPSPCVTDAFREILHRDPGQSELQSYSAASRDRTWLKSQLRESEEHRSVVGPLRKRLLREWQTWQFRQPTNAELKLCIDGTRHKCGGDDGVRRALADGSIETRLDFRPITMEMDITNQCNLRSRSSKRSQLRLLRARMCCPSALAPNLSCTRRSPRCSPP